MNRYFGGLIAGWAATFVISILILVKGLLGFAPELELVGMPSRMLGVAIDTAWVIHVLIGTAWGLLFAAGGDRLPGRNATLRGLCFGALAWLLMMVAVMPLAGAGLFGLNLGLVSPATTLVLHLAFGLVMGAAYGYLTRPHGHGRGSGGGRLAFH